MKIEINFKNRVSDKSAGNLILFVDEKLNITDIKKVLSNLVCVDFAFENEGSTTYRL